MIPFNTAVYDDDVRAALSESLDSMKTSGDGAFTERCRALLERELGTAGALLTTSCTHALEMSALLLDIQPGDEVIVPSFTFVSTANAFALRGAKVVFADVDERTLNLTPESVARLTTPKTRAIVPVHYAGVGCEMDELLALCSEANLTLIEDNAHGLFGKYKGRWLGTMGAFGTQSFHETKNFYCGEGGALLINDEQYLERAEIVREKGTNRARFFRGEIDKYSWVDLGSSYLLADINAAILFPQLERRLEVQARRQTIWSRYQTELNAWAERQGVMQPHIPRHCDQAYHLYQLRFANLDTRTRFIEHLRARGVWSVFHYLPLHLSEFGRRYGGEPGDCPVSERASETLARLPLFGSLTPDQVDVVVAAVTSFDC